MKEIWKDIINFPNYQVSNFGNVKSKKYGRLKLRFDKKGYLLVYLYIKNKRYIKRVHRLVAQAFLPNPNNLPQINHKDEIKHNNNIDNLEWCSNKYNCNYGHHNKNLSNSRKQKIDQYDLQGNFVKTWNSIQEAKQIYGSGVHKCCSGIIKKTKGYIFKYHLK